jgi:molecular chaperone GrpE (heat shock protein)
VTGSALIMIGSIALAVATGCLSSGISKFLAEEAEKQRTSDNVAATKRHELAKFELVLRSVAHQPRPIEESRARIAELSASIERLEAKVKVLQHGSDADRLAAITQACQNIKTQLQAVTDTLESAL